MCSDLLRSRLNVRAFEVDQLEALKPAAKIYVAPPKATSRSVKPGTDI
jgi:hypothetical protein